VKPPSRFDIAILPRIFPNVVDFYISRLVPLKPNCLNPWHSKLNQFFGGSYDDIGGIFKSRIWSNLTTLELFGGDNDAMDYLDSLINTPAVKHLKLNNMRLRMDDFEFIHNTLSSLNALTLLNVD
jgi:hypothetical protein